MTLPGDADHDLAQGCEWCPNTGSTHIGPKRWRRCNDCTLTINAEQLGAHQRPSTDRLRQIAALYVDTHGPYAGEPGVDVWGIKRDARTYDGPHPVVAHPPCNTWCQLASVNQKRWGTVIGADGGTFAAALDAVRTFGGVLEHPAYSIAWKRFGLPTPTRGCWTQSLHDPGMVTEISQVMYGHAARKRTWLYAIGVEPTEMRWGEVPGRAVVGAGINSGECVGRGRLSPSEAIHTPPAFLAELIALARTVDR